MRRSRRVDWLLLATLLPVYVVMQFGQIQTYLASGERALPFRLSGAQGAHGYPIVLSLRVPHSEIQSGDRSPLHGPADLERRF